jgi:hypothetical protein
MVATPLLPSLPSRHGRAAIVGGIPGAPVVSVAGRRSGRGHAVAFALAGAALVVAVTAFAFGSSAVPQPTGGVAGLTGTPGPSGPGFGFAGPVASPGAAGPTGPGSDSTGTGAPATTGQGPNIGPRSPGVTPESATADPDGTPGPDPSGATDAPAPTDAPGPTDPPSNAPTPSPAPTGTPEPTIEPTTPPTEPPTPAPTPCLATAPNLVGEHRSSASRLWGAAGFTGVVTATGGHGNYVIASQDRTPGTGYGCDSGVTIGP